MSSEARRRDLVARMIGACNRASEDPFLSDLLVGLIESMEAELRGRIEPKWFGTVSVEIAIKDGLPVNMKVGGVRSVQISRN